MVDEPRSRGDAAQTRKIIEQTVEAMHELDGHSRDYVTRTEFARDMDKLEARLEVRLENAMLKTRNWVLSGIIASAMIFGLGFMSLISRIDQMAVSVTGLQKSMETRRDWTDESDERDRRQDAAIKKMQPDYEPQPFEVRVR